MAFVVKLVDSRTRAPSKAAAGVTTGNKLTLLLQQGVLKDLLKFVVC
jgi:hypothetical protein